MSISLTSASSAARAWRALCVFSIVLAILSAGSFLLSSTFAWSSMGQRNVGTAQGDGTGSSLIVTMEVQRSDGAPLTEAHANKPFSFSIDLTSKSGMPHDDEVAYAIYQLPAELSTSARSASSGPLTRTDGADIAQDPSSTASAGTLLVRTAGDDDGASAADASSNASSSSALSALQVTSRSVRTASAATTTAYGWDLSQGVPVESGTVAAGTMPSFALSHGQYLELSNLPHGTAYQIGQWVEPTFSHRAFGASGVVTKGGSRADLLNVYAPSGIIVSKAVENLDGTELTAEQLEQEFSFAVSFSKDGVAVKNAYAYELYDEGGNIIEPKAQDAVQGSADTNGTTTDTSSAMVLHLKVGQRAEFTDVDAGVEFTVEEVNLPDGYTAETASRQGVVLEAAMTEVPFKNVFGHVTEDVTGELRVSKNVVRQEGGALPLEDIEKQFVFHVNLEALQDAEQSEGYGYTLYREDARTEGLIALTDEEGARITGVITAEDDAVVLRHGEIAVFRDLPAGTSWKVTEDAAEGYAPAFSSLAGSVLQGEAIAEFTNMADERFTTIEGTKTWDLSAATSAEDAAGEEGDADASAAAPDTFLPENITVRLVPVDETEGAYEVTVAPDIDGVWKYAFELPRYDEHGEAIDYDAAYRIEEKPVTNFEATYEGYDILNTYVAPVQEALDPEEPVEPVEPVEPIEPEEPIEPVEPVEPIDPVGPQNPIEPRTPIDPNESSEELFDVPEPKESDDTGGEKTPNALREQNEPTVSDGVVDANAPVKQTDENTPPNSKANRTQDTDVSAVSETTGSSSSVTQTGDPLIVFAVIFLALSLVSGIVSVVFFRRAKRG